MGAGKSFEKVRRNRGYSLCPGALVCPRALLKRRLQNHQDTHEPADRDPQIVYFLSAAGLDGPSDLSGQTPEESVRLLYGEAPGCSTGHPEAFYLDAGGDAVHHGDLTSFAAAATACAVLSDCISR